jgi:hypothetical protein
MDDIVDELLKVAVGCREAGVPREEALAVVRDCYNAPWSADDVLPVSSIRRAVEAVFLPTRRAVS